LPEKETVADLNRACAQGRFKQVLRYWQTDYGLAQGGGAAQRRAETSSPKSTGWNPLHPVDPGMKGTAYDSDARLARSVIDN